MVFQAGGERRSLISLGTFGAVSLTQGLASPRAPLRRFRVKQMLIEAQDQGRELDPQDVAAAVGVVVDHARRLIKQAKQEGEREQARR